MPSALDLDHQFVITQQFYKGITIDIEQSEEFKTTKYFLQLLGFAVISELPWYLHNGVDGTHNVLFTLALGVMALAAFETLKKEDILCGAVILSTACFAT